jgi:hypothetical protein
MPKDRISKNAIGIKMQKLTSGLIPTLEPAVSRGGDFVWLDFQDEGLWLGIVLGDERLIAACRSTMASAPAALTVGLRII